MDPVRTLIVEDERLARARLTRLLRQRADVEIVGSAADGDEAVELIAGARPELLLLDIQIPSRSGFDVLDSFEDDQLPFVIFTTAFSEHALRAFEVHALDYLLKPFDEERLHAAIDRAVKIVRGTREFNEGRAPLTRSSCASPAGFSFSTRATSTGSRPRRTTSTCTQARRNTSSAARSSPSRSGSIPRGSCAFTGR